jgi:prepilin-type N-terminal cleavage/methylation domain-containing protein
MKQSRKNQTGFTLIELLVAVAIVGILTSIAIPQYKEYRAKAYDAVALSDIRSVALAEESYLIDNQQYYACTNDGCSELPGIIKLSKGVTLEVQTTDDNYIIIGKHALGSKEFRWDASLGGLVP